MDNGGDGGEMDVDFLCCEMDVKFLLILTVDYMKYEYINNNVRYKTLIYYIPT